MSAEVDFRGTAMAAFALTVAAMCAATPLVFLFRSDVSVELLLASMFVAIMANAVDVGQEFERAKLRPPVRRNLDRAERGERRLWPCRIWLGWGGRACSRRSAWALSGIILKSRRRSHEDRALPAQPVHATGALWPAADAGWPSVALYSTCDRLIVAWLLGKDAAGIFGVAAICRASSWS